MFFMTLILKAAFEVDIAIIHSDYIRKYWKYLDHPAFQHCRRRGCDETWTSQLQLYPLLLTPECILSGLFMSWRCIPLDI